MNAIASRDQFKPIRIGEDLMVNYKGCSKGEVKIAGYCMIMDRDGVEFHKLAKTHDMSDVLGNQMMTGEIRISFHAHLVKILITLRALRRIWISQVYIYDMISL